MGDRTWARVSVLAEHKAAALRILDNICCGYGPVEGTTSLFVMEFEEANYGQIEELKQLEAAGIAFDHVWGPGDTFEGCTHYLRFTEDGEPDSTYIGDAELSLTLHSLIDLTADPDALARYIREKYTATQPKPWDNQLEYGKRHQLRTLVTQ
ncbi:hypothetical protein [Larsenimonas suaedae]|uniref:Uncharacterized protein n=1 Tax=Larsenimonas suaedae TaxID=1851019 RepID=A0ABU1GZK3_9GAMM|nr:hypothetical protein [Larsenimonas suaedae]MCM2973756.1 hypothetical protein [Larsenimonas suaedae]MDR5897280.1 hypothetical protein [Larsenimonas suaedae]